MFFMERLHELSHFPTENAFQGPLFRCHHMNFDAAATQSCRNLKPDKACTKNDCLARRLCACDDGTAIRKRTKRMNVRPDCPRGSRDEPAQPRWQAAIDHTEYSARPRARFPVNLDQGG